MPLRTSFRLSADVTGPDANGQYTVPVVLENYDGTKVDIREYTGIGATGSLSAAEKLDQAAVRGFGRAIRQGLVPSDAVEQVGSSTGSLVVIRRNNDAVSLWAAD